MPSIILRTPRVALGLLLNLVYLIASGVPRNAKLWVFGAWNGRKFLDNPKYVYLRTLEHAPDIRPVWVTKDAALARSLRRTGYPALFAYSPLGIWAQLRAGVVVFTHSVEWDLCAPLIASRVKRVQTWHGMPIKKIGYDDQKSHPNPKGRAQLLSFIFPFRADRCDLVIAASDSDKSKYESAFNVRPDKVIITGYPRNDALLRGISRAQIPPKKKVIYMPTLRGGVGSEFQLFETMHFDFEGFDRLFQQLGVDFYIKLHPVQKFRKEDLVAIKKCTNIFAIFNVDDIYEVIGTYDLLLTDYSGIYFDFLISGKPIVMAPFDLQAYQDSDRDLYYRYEDLCPDTPCSNWHEVAGKIQEKLSPGYSKPDEQYRALQARFHRYLDDRSSARVVDEVVKLVACDECH